MGLYTILKAHSENAGYWFQMESPIVTYSFPQKQQTARLDVRPEVQNCLEQFRRLSTIQANWDSYNAPAPRIETIEGSVPFVKMCLYMNLIPDDIGASVEGGITISFTKNEKYAAVEFYNSGETLALLSRPIGSDVWEPKLDPIGIAELIKQLKYFLG
jgi:hypothetical protein